MRQTVRIPIALALAATLSCNTLLPRPTPTPVPTATPLPTPTPVPPTPTVAPTQTATPIPHSDLYIEPGDVIIHPDSEIYAGDIVSFEVFAHDGANIGLSNFSIALYANEPNPNNQIGLSQATSYGLGERLQATFVWVWNTAGLVGPQTLTVVLDPRGEIQNGDENESNNTLAFTVDVQPRTGLAPAERYAEWITAESECCIFNYITGSAAERDLELIQTTADRAVRYVETKVGREAEEKIVFNLINRLLGHGGFASDTVTISYLDRDYAGGGLENVFRHEAAHILNRAFGRERPAIIEEGAATYITGGHFKEEPFEPRLIGLLALDRYIPLAELTDDFYNAQHEIGYLEGAALIDYLVNMYGWERFVTLLGAFQSAGSQSAMLDAGLRLAYDKTLAELEAEWLAHLRAQPVDERWRKDIEYTVAYYDTVRRYQQANDPSAHFLTAWIPDISQAVRDDIVADYSRHPETATNIALETMLIEIDRAIEAGDFDTVRRYLDSVNAVLEAGGIIAVDSLAADHFALTEAALSAGYEPQHIQLAADSATVIASLPDQPAALTDLKLTRINGVWRVN
ncbi:MAG TPA: hypothetical protein VI547_12400 [Anaerolineales bacterium]|nr:hypothetical protein [Anaerolineales bacterium]